MERFTRNTDVVCDPMMGTGTMGLSCMRYRRSFVGIEMDAERFATARERIVAAAGAPEAPDAAASA